MASVIQPEKILRELDELWVSLGKQEQGSDAVLRACAMTLVVATENHAEQDDVGETLAHLMRDHPSRAIVLRAVEGTTTPLGARVFAQCWMPFGRRQQICCEQVEIVANEGGLLDVAPVLRSLLVPDLPVILWCRARHLLELADFEPVLRLANKLVVDSAGISDLEGQLALLQRARSQDRCVGDLAWARLTRWRESIAQIFDNPVYLGRLDEIREVHIDFEGAHRPLSACYVAAWLSAVLGRDVRFEFRRAGDANRARVQTVALRGGGVDVSIAVSQDRAVSLHAGVRDSHTVFPSLSDYELLREELAVLRRDPVFDEVVRRAPEFLPQSG
jgi:glucose-6-phosphate dehydrogenase assembly protein OpcA